MVDKDQLDYHVSSGAGDAEDKMKDGNHPDTEQASGDVGATTFDPSDAPADEQSRYYELRKRHHEHFNKDGNEDLNNTDIAYDARVVCNQLELTDVQEARTLSLITEHRKSGIRYELTIMAVASYVLNEDGRWIQRRDGGGDPLSDVYYELLDSFGLDTSSVNERRSEIANAQNDSG